MNGTVIHKHYCEHHDISCKKLSDCEASNNTTELLCNIVIVPRQYLHSPDLSHSP